MDQTALREFLETKKTAAETSVHDRQAIQDSFADLELLKIAISETSSLEEAEILLNLAMQGVMIVHPRDEKDIFAKYNFLNTLAKDQVHKIQEAHWITLLDIMRCGNLRIPVLSLPLTPEYLIPPFDRTEHKLFQARQSIVEEKKNQLLAILKLFESKGDIPIILGALTGRLARFLKGNGIKSPLVTGIYLTPWIISGILEQIATIASERVIDFRIALVGGAGNMGQAILNWLIAEGFAENLTIIEATENELGSLSKHYPEIGTKDLLTDINAGVKDKDIVIVATASPRALINADMLSPGTIVIDDTHPSNVGKDIQNDKIQILRVMAHVPELSYVFPMDQKKPDEAVTCLAEGIIVAENRDALTSDYHQALVNPERAVQLFLMRKISRMAEELGISSAPFRDYENFVPEQTIVSIRSLRE